MNTEGSEVGSVVHAERAVVRRTIVPKVRQLATNVKRFLHICTLPAEQCTRWLALNCTITEETTYRKHQYHVLKRLPDHRSGVVQQLDCAIPMACRFYVVNCYRAETFNASDRHKLGRKFISHLWAGHNNTKKTQ